MSLEFVRGEYERMKSEDRKEHFDERFSQNMVAQIRYKDRSRKYHLIVVPNTMIKTNDPYADVVYAAWIKAKDGEITLHEIPSDEYAEVEECYVDKVDYKAVEEWTERLIREKKWERDVLGKAYNITEEMSRNNKHREFYRNDFTVRLLDDNVVKTVEEAEDVFDILRKNGRFYERHKGVYWVL